MGTVNIDHYVVSKSLERVNGDAAFISEQEGKIFICIFDGAGHGNGANGITNIAIDYIKKNKNLLLTELMINVHNILKGTHGGVAILAKIDNGKNKLSYVGIGNIFLRVFGKNSKREITQGGVIGYQIRTPKEKTIVIDDGDVVVFHTDGISSQFNEVDYPDILKGSAEKIAKNLLAKFGKKNDDATCVVLKFV
jgi:serine/threonine protein phosphatase PrpC